MIYSGVFADFYVILNFSGFEGSLRFDHFLCTHAPNLFLEMSKWIWGSQGHFPKNPYSPPWQNSKLQSQWDRNHFAADLIKGIFPTTTVFNGNRAIFMHFHLRLLLWNTVLHFFNITRTECGVARGYNLKLYFSAISRSISDTGRIEMTKCKRRESLVGQLTMWAVPKLFTLSSLIFGKLFWDPSLLLREKRDIEKLCHLLK